MAARMVALEKFPGVIPVGIGEVCRCLLTKLILQAGGAQSKEACVSVNLCLGLEAGIYGMIHVVR